MRIIIAPAKQMKVDTDTLECTALPVFTEKAEILMEYINSLSPAEQKKLWACGDKIADENHKRFADMDLRKRLTPAILAYDGIQYAYMAPGVLEQRHIDYLQENLRILSGFYGVLKPLDGVVSYRLEMQAKAKVNGCKNLYEFWGYRLYREVLPDDGVIINLASKEYSKCVEKYIKPHDRFITIVFGELTGGKVTQKGVYAKMARGEMARFAAETNARTPEALKEFASRGYSFDASRSTESEYVFLK